MRGRGQEQLARYTTALPGVPGTMHSFVVPYGAGELVVNSYGQRGMLYYYYRNRARPKPQPAPVPAPASTRPRACT